jgi:uncharacterized protein (DUF433 family)
VTTVTARHVEPWRKRLYLPNYKIGEAAKYAHIDPTTVARWHHIEESRHEVSNRPMRNPTLSAKEKGSALSYVQLIEVAVVAAFRKGKIKLPEIRRAREYAKNELGVDYPFANLRFKTDGKHLLIDYRDLEGAKGVGKHLVADQWGQLDWDVMIAPLLRAFEYEHEDIVVQWHVGGADSPIIIDPRLSFGAPTIKGTPTWIIAGRCDAGESNSQIAEDFDLTVQDVKLALGFERGEPSPKLH